jgi:hypothetical protein
MSTLPEFDSDPTSTIVSNFRRLAIQEGWTKKSKSYKEGRRAFFAEAVETGFISNFGANASNLQAWQSLCRTIGVENVDTLTSIKKCRKVRFGSVLDEIFTDYPPCRLSRENLSTLLTSSMLVTQEQRSRKHFLRPRIWQSISGGRRRSSQKKEQKQPHCYASF